VNARVVVRRCPDCGAPVLGREGIDWFACTRCPVAFDPFSEPVRRIETLRTPVEEPAGEVRLPFYRFRIVPSVEATEEPPAPARRSAGFDPLELRRSSRPSRSIRDRRTVPALAWVLAVRIIGIQTHGDAGARLTESAFDPPLEPAPLGVAVVRGPGAAGRLLRARLGLGPADPLDVTSVSLVSLPCRREGRLVREAASGLLYPEALVRPAPAP